MRSTMPPTTPKTEDDGMSMALVLAMPSETKLFTSLGFQMSTFKVSEYPNQRFYSVHKNLLTQIGGKLKKQAKDLRQSQLIEIPNVDPQIFGFLVDYLYRDTVQTVKIDSNSIEQHTTLTNLCVYYAFLERMQVRYKLLNKVMDSIQDGFCITGTMPDPEFCKSIFANTTPDSQLRKFGVACAAAGFLQSNTTSEQLVAFLKDEEFAYGFLDALRWLDRDVDPRVREVVQGLAFDGNENFHAGLPPCIFHIHGPAPSERKARATKDKQLAKMESGKSANEKAVVREMEKCHLSR